MFLIPITIECVLTIIFLYLHQIDKNLKYIVFLLLSLCFSTSGIGQTSFEEIISDCRSKYENENNISLRQKRAINCLVGNKLPNFNGKTVNGKEIDLKELQGSVVVINLWFRNCGPCRAEMPGLNKLYDKYKKKGVEFIGLSTDSRGLINHMLETEIDFKFDLIPDAKDIIYHDLLLTYGFPTTIILDKDGVIRHIEVGANADDKTAENIFNKLSTQLQMCL